MADEVLLPAIKDALSRRDGKREDLYEDIKGIFNDVLEEDPIAKSTTQKLRKNGYADETIIYTFIDQAILESGGILPSSDQNVPRKGGKLIRDLDAIDAGTRRSRLSHELMAQRQAESIRQNTKLVSTWLDKYESLKPVYQDLIGKDYDKVKSSIETGEDLVGNGPAPWESALTVASGLLSIPEKLTTSIFSPVKKGIAVRVPNRTRNKEIAPGGFVNEIEDPNEFLVVPNPYVAIEISGRFLEEGPQADLSDLEGEFQPLSALRQSNPSLRTRPIFEGPSFEKEPLYPALPNAPKMSQVPMMYEILSEPDIDESALRFAKVLPSLGMDPSSPTWFENVKSETGSTSAAFVMSAPLYALPLGPRIIRGKKTTTVAPVLEAEKTLFESVSPSIEKAYRSGAPGIVKNTPTAIEKASESLANLRNQTFRGIAEHLPRGQYGDLREELIALSKSRGTSSILSQKQIQKEFKFIPTTYEQDLFTHSMVLNDIAENVANGIKVLPFGYTPKILRKDLARLSEEIASNPNVKKAIQIEKAGMADLRERYIDTVGRFIPGLREKLSRTDYFPNHVIEMMQAIDADGLASSKIKVPKQRGFLKKREGYDGVFSTNYPQVKWLLYTQMEHDIQVAKVLGVASRYDKYEDIARSLKSKGFKGTIEDVEGAIPEGHSPWYPESSRIFYMANTLDERLAKKITEDLLGEIGVSADDLGRAMAMGGNRKPWILPTEIVQQLNKTSLAPEVLEFRALRQKVLHGWKAWKLTAPQSVVSYNFGNLLSDIGMTVAGNPSLLANPANWKYLWQSAKDLWPLLSGNLDNLGERITPYIRRGGAYQSSRVAELGDLRNLSELRALHQITQGAENFTESSINSFSQSWKKLRLLTDYRENILRYANYLHAKDSLQKFGKLPSRGASMASELASLSSVDDISFKWSQDLLGRFDDLSANTRALASDAYPFFSWRAVNADAHKRLVQNAFMDYEGSSKILKSIGVGGIAAIPVAVRLGTLATRVASTYALMQVWNNLKFPEIEEGMGKTRWVPHITLGKTEDGKALTLPATSAFYDMMSWAGMAQMPGSWDQFLYGRMSLGDVLKEHAFKAPMNVLYQQANPFGKEVLEQMTSLNFFPDVFDPRPMKDASLNGRIAHAFRIYSSLDFYNAMTGQPADEIQDQIKSLFIREIEPGLGNFMDSKKLVRQFLSDKGKLKITHQVGFETKPDKEQALLNLSQALRHEDEELSDFYFRRYVLSGGEKKELERDFKAGEPLGALSSNEKIEFLKTLTPEQKEVFSSASKWYAKNANSARIYRYWLKKEKEMKNKGVK